jgi:hypothetical protein
MLLATEGTPATGDKRSITSYSSIDASNSRGVSNRRDASNSRHTVEIIMAEPVYRTSPAEREEAVRYISAIWPDFNNFYGF